jgi:hypothetical protein
VRTFVVPRGTTSSLTRAVFLSSRRLFETVARPSRSYRARDRVMALYAPITLLVLPLVWLALLMVAFAGMFWALGADSFGAALRLSGSSLLTLGFERPASREVVLTLVEAVLGLATVALLISYLPTMYGTFSRREAMVTRLSVRGGTPPSSVELLELAQRAGFLDALDTDLFDPWEGWFEEVEESHTSLGALSFFRSPNPDRSWITAAGCVLDTASLRYALLDMPFTPQAGVCIRSGTITLRAIARAFDQPFDPDPAPDAPISVAREEFEEVYRRLAGAGLPLRSDLDQAWRDFRGWRVNYDEPLLSLCALLMAPYAPWSSDRSLRRQLPRLVRRTVRPPRATTDGPPDRPSPSDSSH